MGTQNRLNFLPEQHTDFIFAVVGEELGFLGGALLLALFFALLWRGMTIASSAKELFGSLVAAGVVSMFAFHIVVNVGMTIGVMPVTGLPLPFVSYGGSSLLVNCIGVGLLLNVYMRRHKIRF
jgi:rod shape determining protein RodA